MCSELLVVCITLFQQTLTVSFLFIFNVTIQMLETYIFCLSSFVTHIMASSDVDETGTSNDKQLSKCVQ